MIVALRRLSPVKRVGNHEVNSTNGTTRAASHNVCLGSCPIAQARKPTEPTMSAKKMIFLKLTAHRYLLTSPPAHRGVGGADRDRTGGLLVANQALSQLSYSPLTRS